MRKREEIHRDLTSSGEVSKKDKVMLEVALDTRELLEKLLLKMELQEKKALLLDGGEYGMGQLED